MRKVFSLLFHFKLKELLIEPTEDTAIQAVRYIFVGGIATLADWAVLFGLQALGVGKYVAAAAGFCAGLVVNFFLSKLLVFRLSKPRTGAGFREFIGHAVIGLVGLGLTELLLYLFTDVLPLPIWAGKAAATVLTMIWNFCGRKFILYKKGGPEQ